MNFVMWQCQLVLRFHVFAQKKADFLMLFYLCLIKGFMAAAFHGSLQNHLQNIRHLKVIFLRVPHRLQSAGCWMPLNWNRPYLKGNRCRQSFKNIKSYSTTQRIKYNGFLENQLERCGAGIICRMLVVHNGDLANFLLGCFDSECLPQCYFRCAITRTKLKRWEPFICCSSANSDGSKQQICSYQILHKFLSRNLEI